MRRGRNVRRSARPRPRAGAAPEGAPCKCPLPPDATDFPFHILYTVYSIRVYEYYNMFVPKCQ